MKISKILSLLLLISCSTPYQPKGALGGYSSEKIGANTYMVEFKGNQHTSTLKTFEYLERRCAEITIENGYDYFIVYEDSSYVIKTIIENKPGIDEMLAAQRSNNNILIEEQVLGEHPVHTYLLLDENPVRTYIGDRNSKIARTFNKHLANNVASEVNGVFKILLTNDVIENYTEYYHPAKEILEKYSK